LKLWKTQVAWSLLYLHGGAAMKPSNSETPIFLSALTILAFWSACFSGCQNPPEPTRLNPDDLPLSSDEVSSAQSEAESFYKSFLTSRPSALYAHARTNGLSAYTPDTPTEDYSHPGSSYVRKMEKDRGSDVLSVQDVARWKSSAGRELPSDHPMIKKLAALLTSDSKNDVEKVLNLHDFVLWRLTYIESAEHGANQFNPDSSKAKYYECASRTNSPVAVFYKVLRECGISAPFNIRHNRVIHSLIVGMDNCYGYAHLFVSLARAAGIPARIAHEPWKNAEGGANSAHQWAQVFIGGKWRVVDPTFDDGFDQGQYLDSSPMNFDLSFFLISPEEAATLDPTYHAKYAIDQN
jgi:transglutaminase/protease-like cytokinesis protein 3